MTPDEVDGLRNDVLAYAERRRGKIYAPIDHPSFSDIPYEHGPERWEIIQRHLPRDAKSALDIGTHWGFFAHQLERSGLRVTAVENMKEYLPFLQRIRILYGDSFTVYSDSVFQLPGIVQFDVVLALNIFHHFLKDREHFRLLSDFLARLDCSVLFFQAHDPAEGQMAGAFRNFSAAEFCQFISLSAGLPHVEEIGRVKRRPMFRIYR